VYRSGLGARSSSASTVAPKRAVSPVALPPDSRITLNDRVLVESCGHVPGRHVMCLVSLAGG
jgi:hypothetical protein